MLAGLPIRTLDAYGEGIYGASRGDRTHKGVDLACYPGTDICPIYAGKVTKLGFPYKDDLTFRYVEVTVPLGLRMRFFYVDPQVEVGDSVRAETIIGRSQDLSKRYPKGITNHVHFEVKNSKGEYIDPTPFIFVGRS